MERLLRKFETGRSLLPRPVLKPAAKPTPVGVIHYGSTAPAMDEAQALLVHDAVHVDTLRVRAFPLALEIAEFVRDHDQVFVIEQNRDAQMRTLMSADLELAPAELTSILHFGGMPITARFIVREIACRLRRPASAQPLERVS
jgi:2-oxoglutarate/2-oxoacid ferredoxin oxidoreductase subunit alpha